MKSSVVTRIFLSLTPDEARIAVNNATDLQLCVRSALYQMDGTPVKTLIENNHKRLAMKHRQEPTHICPVPGCGKRFFKAGYLPRHITKEHPDTGATTPTVSD